MTPYPWVGALSGAEIQEMVRELIAALFESAMRDSLEPLRGTLAAWRSTAELYGHPELVAEMLAPIDKAALAAVEAPPIS